MTSPSSATSPRNRSREGRLNANSTDVRVTRGESTCEPERITWQCAVPPRISGP